MSLPRVVTVAPASPAELAGLVAGDEIASVNGEVPRDLLEWRSLVDEPHLSLEVRRGGLESLVVVDKRAGEPLGVDVHSALFDRVRTCDNHCEFCFIYQLPPGLRRSLYLKDDDYRLSFLYGNFTTLTRFTEADLERVVTEGLSPLYVSIHATDPAVRAEMLRNRRGATSLRWLRALLDHGVEVHGQVVVCPGVNDGAVLDDTLAGTLDRFPELASLCVVPLGVSRFNTEGRMRPHTTAEAASVVDAVHDWQDVYLRVLGRRLVFAADEYYLLADRPFPEPATYGDFAMHEDGIGMARAFEAELLGGAGPRRDDDDPDRGAFFRTADGELPPTRTNPAPGAHAPSAAGAPSVGGCGTVGVGALDVSGSSDADYEPYRAGAGDRRPAAAHRAQPPGPRGRAHGALRCPRAVSAAGPTRPPRPPGDPGREPLLRRQRRRVGAHGRRGPRPRARRRARGPPLPAARRVPHPGRVPRRHRPRGPAPHGRGGAHRRCRAAAGARPPAGGRARGRRRIGELTVARPVVAIVGRPNVGKSTLLNRIVGRRAAIVEERPGVTRDRKDVDADWLGRPFHLVDTGGWMARGSDLDDKVSAQSERAIADADVVLFVVDVVTGATEDDAEVAELLRRSGKPVLLVVNKVDDSGREHQMWELLSLGLGEPYPVSALHGRGTGDLLDRVVGLLPEDDDAEPVDERSAHRRGVEGAERGEASSEDETAAVAIMGRPNVGKSTLFNRLTGDDRSVVHDLPGTTRDTIDTIVETELGPIRLVDTAGMRRRSRIDEGTEYYSLVRALQAVDEADVALLVIDATEGVTGQDQRLAERIDAAGCPIVVILNKWELLDAEQRADVRWQVSDKLRFVGDAPVLQVSALSGKGVHKLFPALATSVDAYHRRIPTSRVNAVLRDAQGAHPAPGGARVLYATQGAAEPPTFTLFVNRELPRTYLRYLERKLREAFDLGATPVKLRVRRRGE